MIPGEEDCLLECRGGKGWQLAGGRGKRGYLVPYVVRLGEEGVVRQSYFPSLTSGFCPQVTILEAFFQDKNRKDSSNMF